MSLSTRIYKKTECITFKNTRGRYGALSNMSPKFSLYIDGNFIRNSEALYQALRFPDYPEIQKRIICISSPISAKNFSRCHIEKTRSDWGQCRFKIMKFCIELKLYQNKESFSKELLSTKDLAIVEYTERDKVWGATAEGDYYIGTNALGRLLMELRENLQNDLFKVSIPEIENFVFLGKKIDTDLFIKDYNDNCY